MNEDDEDFVDSDSDEYSDNSDKIQAEQEDFLAKLEKEEDTQKNQSNFSLDGK